MVNKASLSTLTPSLTVFFLMLYSGDLNKDAIPILLAMKLAVEEINSDTQSLLPGVMLGYQIYDVCSVSASILAALDVLDDWSFSVSGSDPNISDSQRPLAVIGPDSSSKSFPSASLLGTFLIPQVSQTSNVALEAYI